MISPSNVEVDIHIEKENEYIQNKTEEVFNKNFDGFEFNVGDKKMKYNIQNVQDVKNTQIDINNFVGNRNCIIRKCQCGK